MDETHMTAPQPTQRILWAVDPFAEDIQLQRATAWALKAYVRGREAEIVPVYVQEPQPAYVYGPYGVGVSLDLASEPVLGKVRAEAQAGLNRIARPTKLPGLQPLQILPQGSSSLQGGVAQLLKHARDARADLIALSTRAKSGPARWFLGSFAETLSLSSDIPLLIVNPRWTRRSNFKQILFATDFSEESRAAFRKVVALANAYGARIRLLHKLKYDLTPGVEVAFTAYPQYKRVFDEEVRAREAEAARWAGEARAAGVAIETEVDAKLGGSVADAILKRAKGKACLIAMASHSGPAWRALIGSTSRKVLRAACDPVWIIHPEPGVKEKLFEVTEGEVMEDLTHHARGA
jgi:nucleotide-binding universal stress UspA family protein